ncbi:pentatricopeptide repeat-containing protein At1g62680, mitochondrial-like [Gossypium raimondii]|uniref:pentatricopeptide repeat-containing protein At1g62680, mitochondrial-like n=1 Tax=Gossypium raimondii TaxID=29730 RepID=UPI00227D6F39|nr:pentatricopeptide repeat-containing protein At1g62680, mitochondrial-like [Gossypium raimondii]
MSMSVRGKGKKDDRSDNVDDALILFNKMIEKYPKPSIVEFTKLLAPIVRMKHYAIVVSMCSQMESLGVSHNVYSMSILINCFCQLARIDFGFSVLGKMLKLGVERTVVTFSTLINGPCIQNKVSEAVSKADGGFQPDILAYNTVIGCLCKNGMLKETLDLFSKVKVKGIRPNIITYNCLIHDMCNSGQQEEATRLLNEMVDINISLDVVTYTILIDALCEEGMISKAVETVDMMIKEDIELDVVTYNTLVDAHYYGAYRFIDENASLSGSAAVWVMIFEALDTTDTMNKQVIARYVSKAEDIVDTMIKRNIEQGFLKAAIPQGQHSFFGKWYARTCLIDYFIVNLDIMRQGGSYPMGNVAQLVGTAPMSTTDSCYYLVR